MSIQSSDDTSHRVLIVAPFGRDAALLTRVLTQAQIQAEACPDIATLCVGVHAGVGAILVADEALEPEAMRLLTECVHGQEPWSDLPVFVLTHENEFEHRLRLKQLEPLGNVTLLERPLRGETLVSAFRMGLRAREHQYQLRVRLEAELEAVRALRESEQRYRKLAESLPQLVWTCTPDGNCDYLSRQWLEYTGVPEQQQLGLAWVSLVHPDDRNRTSAAWQAAYQSGSQYDLEYRLRRHDGQYRWFKTRGLPVEDEQGRVQKWFGSCTDIEDQKRISEERRELLSREQRARRLAELLNRVGPMLLAEMDSALLAQKIIDLATQLTGAQFGAFQQVAAAQKTGDWALSGISRAELDQLGLPPSQDLGQFTVLENLAIARPVDSQLEGGSIVLSYLAVPVISRAGISLGALIFGSREAGAFEELHVKLAEGIAAQAAIALDNARLFAEAQRTQETLRRSNLELRRANEDLNQFAYSASHDLQEPLRMVALYSQMMQRKYQTLLDGTGAEYLGYMVQGARRMELLLKDLLDYTQVVSGEHEEVNGADVNLVLQDAVNNLRQSINESGAKVESSGTLPVLAIKEVHLLQLLQNLIGNALKYRSALKPHVYISAVRDQKLWQLSVRDNGIGIAPQYTKQVFGLFKRLHGNSQYEGTGIGLAICQKIVERYGGHIWVDSEGEGKGCTFSFTLPGVT